MCPSQGLNSSGNDPQNNKLWNTQVDLNNGPARRRIQQPANEAADPAPAGTHTVPYRKLKKPPRHGGPEKTEGGDQGDLPAPSQA